MRNPEAVAATPTSKIKTAFIGVTRTKCFSKDKLIVSFASKVACYLDTDLCSIDTGGLELLRNACGVWMGIVDFVASRVIE